MSTIVAIIFIIIILGIIPFVIAMQLPKSWTIQAIELVEGKPSEIFPLIERVNKWKSWTVWNKQNDESIEINYSQQKRGIGATKTWKSKRLSGILTIVQVSLEESVHYHLDLDNHNFIAKGFVQISPNGGSTQVVWHCESQITSNNPYRILQHYALKNVLMQDIQASLQGLKDVFSTAKFVEA